MSSNKLKVIRFRANDLSVDTGKQFEIGKNLCDFFEIDDSVGEITKTLIFKPLSKAHENLKDKEIDLVLSGLSSRNDRKAYANGKNSGHSAIKEFFLSDLHLTSSQNADDYFAIYKESELTYFLYYVPKLLQDNFLRYFETITPQVTINKESKKKENIIKPLQRIFYGAPGTGKSFKVNEDTNGEAVIRTTFHPDSDYSTFVGAYKPTTTDETVMTVIGTKAVPVEDGNGNERTEPKIIYEFVIQAFLKAYLAAWKKYSEDSENPKAQYLVIEEINRGNCAQIFGDLFQLLDRSGNGFSTYPIEGDTDLQKIISKKFKEKGGLYNLNDNFNVDDEVEDYISNYNATLTDDIKEGRVLLLPKNLYIWATMNTSDQSLFPIDSAFKRRWDWKYIPIANGNKNWKIKTLGGKYDWWRFLNNINDIVEEATSSEDKKLGYYFAKADKDGNISAETFVSKVVFYLWNDVFKDYGFDWKNKEGQPVFKNEEGKDMTFKSFFYPDGSIKEGEVSRLLDNLLVPTEGEDEQVTDPEAPVNSDGKHKYLRSVTFSDGTVFDTTNTKSHFLIYLETIKKIGLETAAPLVENMSYNRKGHPLISKVKSPDIEASKDYSYVQEGDYYFIKGAVDDTLIAILEELKNQLGLDYQVYFVRNANTD